MVISLDKESIKSLQRNFEKLSRSSKPSILPFLSFTAICFGPIIDSFTNFSKLSFHIRIFFLFLCIVLLILCWSCFAWLVLEYKRKLMDIKGLLEKITDLMETQD
jgi:hypothetical protein